MMTCEVLLVDANRALRAGMELLLRSWGHHVVGRASDIESALDLMRRRRPSVTLVDCELAGESGTELVRRAVKADPASRIVLSLGEASRRELEEAMTCGAQGIVSKGDDPQELLEAIDIVAGGGTWIAPSVTRDLAGTHAWVLSGREREVLQLLAGGLSGRQASRALTLSPDTVQTHVRNAVRKLGAKTRVHAVAMALSQREIGDRPRPLPTTLPGC